MTSKDLIDFNKFDLFDNPMIRNAKKAMTPEQLEQYKKIGEQMYGAGKMEKMETPDLDDRFKESAAYIIEGLKSGLLPKDLDTDERRILQEVYGDEWYKKWGYTAKDIS